MNYSVASELTISFFFLSLCQPEVMEELVSLIINDPSNDADEAMKYKYPNIACEILTSDVPQINDMLGDTEVSIRVCV